MRYKIATESSSGHCCFGYSIIDVTSIQYDYCYEDIAETFELQDAIKICEALNFSEGFGKVHELVITNRVKEN